MRLTIALRKRLCWLNAGLIFIPLGLLLLSSGVMRAQITFQSAIELALKNAPRVKSAQDERDRAKAAVSEVNDAYIPGVSLGGGIGRSYGITLTVPTILTTNVQSLVYSAAQRDYLRGAKDSLRAAEFSLADVRQRVEEDTAITYISLDKARLHLDVLREEYELSVRRLAIAQQRFNAGLETRLDLDRSQRSVLEMRVQIPHVSSEVASLQEHLGGLLQLPSGKIIIDSASIPAQTAASTLLSATNTVPPNVALLASDRNAEAKASQLRGDQHYAFRPQVYFQAQYGRISPVNDVSAYYNLNGKYNTFYYAASVQLPLFDRVHAARARETMADAAHLRHEAQLLESQQREDLLGLQNAQQELSSKVDLAEMDWRISRDQLDLVKVEVNTSSSDQTGGRQMNPQDEIDARIDERQHYLDYQDAKLQLQKSQISLLRQTGKIEAWLGINSK